MSNDVVCSWQSMSEAIVNGSKYRAKPALSGCGECCLQGRKMCQYLPPCNGNRRPDTRNIVWEKVSRR